VTDGVEAEFAVVSSPVKTTADVPHSIIGVIVSNDLVLSCQENQK
jgi:hypothetical protein